MRGDAARAAGAVAAVTAVTWTYASWLRASNTTTVALTLLLIVLIAAATSRLWVALVTSVAAMLCLNYFYLPPIGTLAIADLQNWAAVFVFLAVSIIASNLSSAARSRARDATARRDEMTRLFELSRCVLLITDSRDALPLLAELIVRVFELDYLGVCRLQASGWTVAEAGPRPLALDRGRLSAIVAGGDRRATMAAGGHIVTLVPLRSGAKVAGLLAAAGRAVDPGTLDALGGIVAIAIERAQFLEERHAAELLRQGDEQKSALLASLAHDLRTPLTAIRVAAGNLQASWLTDQDRREQTALVLSEVERLTRLFQNILEMARLDAGTVGTNLQWVHPSAIVEAARDQVAQAIARHSLRVTADCTRLVRVDPQLTAASLAHLLENAAQYAPAGSGIDVGASAVGEALMLTVRDHGPGLTPEDLPRVFERFYRGVAAKARPSGTGMGLSIARGLLAVERGRIWVENCPDGGAQFTIAVPADTRIGEAAEHLL